MNYQQEIARIIERSNVAGHFQRDGGNEHEIQGYTIRFTHVHRSETHQELAVVIAPSRQAAITAATLPYQNVKVLSVGAHHLSNPTILRMPIPTP